MYKILHEDAPTVGRAINRDLNQRYKMGRELASDLASVFKDLGNQEDVISRDEKFAIVHQLSFFNDLSDPEVWEVLRASVWENYPGNGNIITEGNIDDSFYIIVKGDVTVCKGTYEIRSLGKGDCFGEMGYLSKTQRSASIVAKDEVSLLKINASLMYKASLSCQLRFNKVFIKTLIERLTPTSERLSS